MRNHEVEMSFRVLKTITKLNKVLEILNLLKFRASFQFWKEHALEDKRIQKMLIRAARHRNRVLRRKIFLSLKRLVIPSFDIMPTRVV